MTYKAISFLLMIVFSKASLSQGADFIILKKHDRTIQTIFAGNSIQFETDKGFYSGKIEGVQKDSIYLVQYDVRRIPTNIGVFILDTAATYHLRFHYKEITKIENTKGRGFNWAASGESLLGGGVLIAAVGLGTWIFTKPGTQYHASTGLILSGAALGGIGYLLLKKDPGIYTIGSKYHLEYIKVKK